MPQSQKNIYHINPVNNYLRCLAKGLLQHCDDDFAKLSESLVILPNKRSSFVLRKELVELSSVGAIIMPQIISIGDFDEDELNVKLIDSDFEELNSLSVISKENRAFAIAQIIIDKKLLTTEFAETTFSKALKLSYSIMSLIDDINKYQVPFENLENILPEELSEHRQISLEFIKDIMTEYPKFIEKKSVIDDAVKRNLITQKLAGLIEEGLVNKRIFFAGSTGSIPQTRNLIKAILAGKNSHNNHVILPYIDMQMPDGSWDDLTNFGDETHNQFAIKSLLDFLEINRGELKPFLNCNDNNSRSEIVSSILNVPKINNKNQNINLDFLNLVEVKNYINEAKVISLVAREKLQEKKTVAIVTNNKTISRLVERLLRKFGVEVDDSSGESLIESEAGVYLLSLINLMDEKCSISTFLSVLKSKYSNPYFNRQKFRDELGKLEFFIRENYISDIISLEKKLPKLKEVNIEENLLSFLKQLIQLIMVIKDGVSDFMSFNKAHIDLFETLSPSAIEDFEEDFLTVINVLKNFNQDDYKGFGLNHEGYKEVLETIFSNVSVRKKYGFTENISILTPIEARLLSFDIVIVASMNLGDWPRQNFSPWMSNNMKYDFGLPVTESFISLAAHDFAELLHNKEVFITRSIYENGEPKVEHPIVSDIKAFAKIFDKNIINNSYDSYLGLIENSGEFDGVKFNNSYPVPIPNRESRVNKISISDVEKIIKSPYSFYAKKILKLKKINKLELKAEAKDYGNFVHEIVEEFTSFHQLNLQKITVDNFNDIARKVYQKFLDQGLPNSILWLKQIEQIASWFIDSEKDILLNVKKIYPEIKGEINLKINEQDFKLIAKADRIEIANDDSLNIYDYKTGNVPKPIDIKKLKSAQTILEVLIAKDGEFEKLGTNQKFNLGKIRYYNLSISTNSPKLLDNYDIDLIEYSKLVKNNLINLFSDLNDEGKPFLAFPDRNDILKYDDYIHLARLEEC